MGLKYSVLPLIFEDPEVCSWSAWAVSIVPTSQLTKHMLKMPFLGHLPALLGKPGVMLCPHSQDTEARNCRWGHEVESRERGPPSPPPQRLWPLHARALTYDHHPALILGPDEAEGL